MSVVVITGSAGLVGSEAAAFFAGLGLDVVGIDNDMRQRFFGAEASTEWNRKRLEATLGGRYTHHHIDIRDQAAIGTVFARHGKATTLVIHAAAQPSHEWAARHPATDFAINAGGTTNLLEATRTYCPDAVFIHLSTNKVYGDRANSLPLVEYPSRWEIKDSHPFTNGIDESMSIDGTMHSLFGASKVAADIMVQEYARYFGLRTTVFRAGCLSGPGHAGTELHGFLAYLMRCAATGRPYTVFGHQGKQVRDNIHSADLIAAFAEVHTDPGAGEVFNIGGGRTSNCSILEAIGECEAVCGREVSWSYDRQARRGDHIWWVSDNSRFESRYPDWRLRHSTADILREIYDKNADRWGTELRRAQ